MKEYKRLGDYIREVNVRNRELEVTNLLGVSISKEFMPSIANTIGTDMSTYKIVKRGQFAYGPVTSRNGDKVSIALLSKYNDAIISQAYTVFEIIEHEQLLPEYLMMWFRRPEFDRYARFHSHGSAREVFDWDELCDVKLPIPCIERQREIVAEYETLTRRIRLNEQIIQHLESIAQSLYSKMFVDGIDKENLPEGWRIGTLGEVIESYSKTHNFNKSNLIFLNTSDIYGGRILHREYSKVSKMPGQAKKRIANGDILFSEIRPANKRYAIVRETNPEDFIVSTKLMVLRMINKKDSNLKIYFYLTSPEVLEELQKQADGASGTFPQITFEENLKNRMIIIGDTSTEKKWNNFLSTYYNNVWNKESENEKLTELQSLLLAKMGQYK
ncbi:MAG: restriction endonuclease subunit S [Bacteroides sp.]|nr:restriction endonuclease subunit S [Bacteroides sp.]